MDSPLFKAPTDLGLLRDSIRNGNWAKAQSIASGLSGLSLPCPGPDLLDYLIALQETLILAKASRCTAAALLARVRVAATFQANRSISPDGRQNSVDTADSWRSP